MLHCADPGNSVRPPVRADRKDLWVGEETEDQHMRELFYIRESEITWEEYKKSIRYELKDTSKSEYLPKAHTIIEESYPRIHPDEKWLSFKIADWLYHKKHEPAMETYYLFGEEERKGV